MKAKKKLGQHFLTNKIIAQKIVNALDFKIKNKQIDCLEIGPGKGILTEFLLQRNEYNLQVVEFDSEAVEYLNENLPEISNKIIQDDILKVDFKKHFSSPLVVIGNLPYNITGPIFFKILENKQIVQQSVVMIQKEVAERIVSPPGSKVYGILSVLLQAFYKIEYLTTVEPNVFSPPPKVRSAVIKLTKLKKLPEIEDWRKFKNIVKAAFNQRRKTLRNALKLYNTSQVPTDLLQKRAEQLSVNDFIQIYNLIN